MGEKGKSLLDITAVKSKEKLKKNDWQGKKTTEAVWLNQEHVKPEGQRETETAGRACKENHVHFAEPGKENAIGRK